MRCAYTTSFKEEDVIRLFLLYRNNLYDTKFRIFLLQIFINNLV